MTAPLNLALTLSLNDRLVGPLQRALGEASKTLRDVSRELEGVGKTGANAAQGLAQVGKQAETLRNATSEVRKLAQETREAERSASRLAGAWQQIRGVTRAIGGVTAGAAAFSAVVAAPIQRAADYDTRLRGLVNTQYGGQGIEKLRGQLPVMDASITAAVRSGGGTREQALDAMEALVAKNKVKDPGAVLPMIMQATTANLGANAKDIADYVSAAVANMGVSPERALAMGTRSGQLGGFELKNMARHLPEQMAIASEILGMKGEAALANLLTMNQQAMSAAGSPDQAASNVKNLLNKINAQDTSRDFKNLGIDLRGSLSKMVGDGALGTDAFVSLVEQVIAREPGYKNAKKAVAGATTSEERRAALVGMQKIAQGAAIGSVVQDMQALSGLLPQLSNRTGARSMQADTLDGAKTLSTAFAFMAEGPGFKFDQRNFEQQKAQTDVMGAANGALGKLADNTTELYRQFPGLAQAIEGSKIALYGFTAALAGSGLVNLLTRGGSAAAGAGAGAAAAAAGGAAAGGLAATGVVGSVAVVGAGLSGAATSAVRANLEMAQYFADDTGLAAAILGAGGGDDRAAVAEAAAKQLVAAETMQRAAEKLENLKISITSDTTMLTSEIMENVARQATRQ